MPHFDVIERLLTNAEAANSLSAKYFHVLMRAISMPPINEGRILADFYALLKTKTFHNTGLISWEEIILLGFAAPGTRDLCLQACVADAFSTIGSTAQEMEEGVIIEGFSLLMMKSMLSTISASAVVLMEKSNGSLMFSALITTSRALVVFRFQLQIYIFQHLSFLDLSWLHFYFVMASLFLSILGLSVVLM